MAEGHRCRCTGCSSYPSGPLRNEGHIAMRLGVGAWRYESPIWWAAALDGAFVEHCYEACPGEPGYVVAAVMDERTGREHICRTCRQGVCADLRIGRVQTWTVPMAAWDHDRAIRRENAMARRPC